jgi:hypothetical protein
MGSAEIGHLLPLVGVLVELPSRKRGLNTKCCRPLDLPDVKKEEEQINAVCLGNED